MAGRGRPSGFKMSDEHRTKIANSQILNRLIKAANGEIEMTPTQATVALGLLKKVMPDLQAMQLSGDSENPVETVTRVELIAPDGNSKD